MRIWLSGLFLLALIVVVGPALAHAGPCLVPPAPHLDSALAAESPWGLQKRAAAGEPVEFGGLSPELWQDGLDEPSDFPTADFLRRDALSERLAANWSAFLRAVGIDQPNFKMLALIPVFPDKAFVTPPQFFDSLLFGPVWGTAAHYWEDQSGGNLRIGTDDLPSAIGLVPMDSTYAYYVNNNYGMGSYPRNSQRLVEDLCRKADALFDIDFAAYDNDGNGFVDGLIVIHPGSGAEWTGSTADIWSHKWQVRAALTLDAVSVTVYSIQPEYWSPTYKMTVGVYAHETGHLFGLPDLYDLDNSSRALGKMSLMSGGSWNAGPGEKLGERPAGLDPWCRLRLGFAEFNTLEAGDVAFADGEIWKSPVGAGGVTGNYYYLLEVRAKEGYDLGVSATGLLIWRCDDTKRSNTKEWYPGHTTTGNYWVALMQATADTIPKGNGFMLERNASSGAAHMAYPSPPYGSHPLVDSIGPETVPSTDWYDGERTNLSIRRMRRVGDTVLATVSFGCYCAVAGDMDGDGLVTWDDLLPDPSDPMRPTLFGHIFFGAPIIHLPDCPRPAGDVDCSGAMDATDGAFLVDLVMNGTPVPCDLCDTAN